MNALLWVKNRQEMMPLKGRKSIPSISCSGSNVNQIFSRFACSIHSQTGKVPSKIRLAFRKGKGIIGDETTLCSFFLRGLESDLNH
jgi:hypothetical protein